jgi:NADPH:quinone reductase-like Zn-dependent oxidoreductase
MERQQEPTSRCQPGYGSAKSRFFPSPLIQVDTMRQIWIPRTGPPEVLTLKIANAPVPADNEVRVRVSYVGVNFADLLGRMGLYSDAPSTPYVPGYEASGEVDAVGTSIQMFKPGDRVVLICRFGGYSDVICVPGTQVFHLPDSIPYDAAAALCVNYLTAYQLIVVMGVAKPNDWVLIHNAGGGVGLAAGDLCRISGAAVIGAASASKHARLRARGIECLDSASLSFVEDVRRITGGRGTNLALDPRGARYFKQSYDCLCSTGKLAIYGLSEIAPTERRRFRDIVRAISLTPWYLFLPQRLANDNKCIFGVNLGRFWNELPVLRTWLGEILSWHVQGRIAPVISAIFPLEKAAEAHRYLHERKNFGKVLLSAQPRL